jgi:hypothetical protein
MKVDIHKEQYRAHCERMDIAHTQEVILHQVRGGKGKPPKAKPHPAYKKWNTSQYNWVEMELQLYGHQVPCFPESAQDDDADDEDSEDSFNYPSNNDEDDGEE